jgi:hypothetical protein
VKPDCSDALRRKRPQSLLASLSRTLLPVRRKSKSCEIAPISWNFRSNPGGFLCTSDCVAEREGFEPSIQVLAHITVWQIQPVPYLLHGINQLTSRQVSLVGQNQGIRQRCMHLSMHLLQQSSH